MGATVVEKKDEKRRALGRGLASLLPGPRAVAPAGAGPAEKETNVPRLAREESQTVESAGSDVPTAGTEAAAVAAGDHVAQIEIEAIDPNPYQTRFLFDAVMLNELAESIKANGRAKKKDAMFWCWASADCARRRWQGRRRCRRW